MPRQIKLMPDYASFPLWSISGETGDIDPEQLPLTKTTQERLLAWADTYAATLNLDDPLASGFASDAEAEAFEHEGIALWHELRNELGPDYEVSYFSDAQQQVFTHPDDLPPSYIDS
ncbi:MAG: hypothetical protein AAGF95_14870 [Chloroflexota bacterium]